MPRDHTFEAPPEPEDELLMLDAGHYFAEEYGTTAAEQAAHEPLDARLARERADVGTDGEAADRPPHAYRIDEPGHWNMLAARHTPGRIDFGDPDVVIDIETLDTEGAVSLWTRDDMRSFGFLLVS
jgi:hypothetical protein